VSGRLEGRVALISGGGRGQGAAHARRLAEEGAKVVFGDVLDAAGEEHAVALRAHGLDVHYRHLDVTSAADRSAAVTEAEERFGRLDTLVNNAGIVRVARVVEETDEGWGQTLAVNATGVIYGMRAAIGPLRRAGGGSIINIASIYGPVGAPGYVAYTASKDAVIAMTKVAALEHAADRIRVNAICPGPVRSPMSEEEGDASVDVTRCAAAPSPRRSRRRSPSWPPTTRCTSPAPSWPSTAATPRAEPRLTWSRRRRARADRVGRRGARFAARGGCV